MSENSIGWLKEPASLNIPSRVVADGVFIVNGESKDDALSNIWAKVVTLSVSHDIALL